MRSRRQPERPVLITEAHTSGDEQFSSRRRRYLLMMTMRAVCIVAAALVVHFSGWLAAAFVCGALVLPWTAVLIANDRPPKEALRFRRFLPNPHGTRELTAGSGRGPDDPPAGGKAHANGSAGRPAGASQQRAEEREHFIIDL